MFFKRWPLVYLEYLVRWLFARKYVATVCGHKTRSIGRLRDGTILQCSEPEYCHDCLNQFVMTCDHCGSKIVPGQTVFPAKHQGKTTKVLCAGKRTTVTLLCTKCFDFPSTWAAYGSFYLAPPPKEGGRPQIVQG